MSNKDLKKAVSAGYEAPVPASPGEQVEEIETSVQSKPQVKVEEIKAESEVKVETPAEASKKAAKFADGLFAPFRLGSSLEQGPDGNVMSNFKKPAMNYVEAAKNTKNQVLTAADLDALKNKK